MKVEDVLNQSLCLVNTCCFKNKLKVDTKISTIFNIVKDEIDINKTSLVDKVINLNGNLKKKNKKTINIEKNKIMKIINGDTFNCLVKFEQSLLSTVPINDKDYLDINFTLYFNEKDLNPISNLLSMNIITNCLWELFAKISEDYLFINQKSKAIHTYLTFGMKTTLYKTDYESLNQNPEVGAILHEIFKNLVLCSKYNIINKFLNIYSQYEYAVLTRAGIYIYECYVLIKFQQMMKEMDEFSDNLMFDLYKIPRPFINENELLIDMNHKYLMVYTGFENEYLEFNEVLTVACVLRQNTSNPKRSTKEW
ncbi:uncharacterized protein LOC132932523 [Metopolophium dirhodum]|uniref:uncharacterized protein LOC132932523 n=1 Tax=Metopolophium dirhodum TaxID=44670 RepID=UPI00298FC229|nr:uncharacterized protein LOC132932523 [Metopolophium dirhodum]